MVWHNRSPRPSLGGRTDMVAARDDASYAAVPLVFNVGKAPSCGEGRALAGPLARPESGHNV